MRLPMVCAVAALLVAIVITRPALPATAATASVVVTATVPSATNLTPTGCATGSAATSFGNVLPGSKNVTPADCSIIFGSSNDTAMLLVHQLDGLGNGMWLPPSGPLDTANFGGASCPCTGTVVSGASATSSDYANAIATQPDGKFVVAGHYRISGGDNGWFVSRFNADGTPDLPFATSGTYKVNPTANDDRACCVDVLPSGDIVVGGGVNFTGDPTPSSSMVLELKPDGTPDLNFNGTGSATVSPGGTGGAQYTAAMAVRPDGDIVIISAPAGNEVGAVALRSDGTLDSAFDGDPGMPGGAPYPGNGKTVHNYFSGCGWTWTATAQPDGKVLVGGQGCAPSASAAVLRLNADGSIDPSFGGASPSPPGTINVDWGASGQVMALAVQPDGKIIAAGPGGKEFHVERFTAAGAVDTTFGSSGNASFDVGNGSPGSPCSSRVVGISNSGAGACALALLPDGRIMIGGVVGITGGTAMGFARLTSSGQLDSTFGTGGTQLYSINVATKSDRASAISFTQDGRMLAAGSSQSNSPTFNDDAVLQLSSTPVSDWNDASATWSLGSEAFGMCLSAVSGGAGTSPGPAPAATWQVNAGCPTSGSWYPVPTAAADTGSKVAQSTTATNQVAQADLRFGFRTAPGAQPGTYLAPVEFDVVAPNV